MARTLTTVFGGTGFLGRDIVRRLLEADHRVRVASRHSRSVPRGDNVEHVPTDVRDADSVAVAVGRASCVVNAVGLYVERGRDTFDAVHVQGAQNVATASARAGARLVHISGIGADLRSASTYVRARALGEQRVRHAAPDSVILRPSVLFGRGDAFLSALERMTRLLPVVPLFGRGDTRLQPVHVSDVSEAVLHALARAETAGRVYELGGPRRYTYRELIATVLAHLERRRVMLPVPFFIWEVQSGCLAWLPNPPLTRDQVILMRDHNVVDDGAPAFAELGIEPRSLEEALPSCLDTARPSP